MLTWPTVLRATSPPLQPSSRTVTSCFDADETRLYVGTSRLSNISSTQATNLPSYFGGSLQPSLRGSMGNQAIFEV